MWFHLGSSKSIFTAELFAILMALDFLKDYPKTIFNILFCVDSKSVLQTLETMKLHIRSEMVIEISHLIHILSLRGSKITFCWIPSHCSDHYNDVADRAAKRGAKNIQNSQNIQLSLSLQECYSLVDNYTRKMLQDKHKKYDNNFMNFDINKIKAQFNTGRKIQSLMFKWKLDAFKTKYNRNVFCLCGNQITNIHIISCIKMVEHIPSLSMNTPENIFNSPLRTYEFFVSLSKSPIADVL